MAVITASIFSQSLEWEQAKKALASDAAAGDNFGWSVAIDGNYAIVGAYHEDEDENGANTENFAGSAYIFKFDEETKEWTQLQKIVASDRAAEDEFGYSVAIDGNYAIVGAKEEDQDENGANFETDAGSAYIFELDEGSGTFSEIQKIVASDRHIFDLFGHSVAIDGNYVIVGATGEDEDENGVNTLTFAGSAYIFELDEGSGTFSEIQKIVASDRVNDDIFGWSVAISGNHAIVGAYREDQDENGANTLNSSGSAYIFELDEGSGTFSEIQKIVASDRHSNDFFGYSLDISGNNIIVGAYGEDEDENGANQEFTAGSAYIFELDEGSGTFTESQKIVASDRAGGDSFGWSVAISGNYAIVGAYVEDEDENGANTIGDAGSAYVFELDEGSGTFTESRKIVASDREANDFFGRSLAIDGNKAIVAAPWEDEGGNNGAGAAYFFGPISTPELYNFTAEATSSESAEFSVDVNDGGANTTYTFDYGTSSGNYSSSYSDEISRFSSTVSVGFNANGLTAGREYFVRARASNVAGSAQTSEISFTTPESDSDASSPTTIGYQGQLTDADGNSVPDGERTATFSLYDALEDGNEAWQEVQTFTTADGLFNIDLGSQTPFGTQNIDFDVPYWLEIHIEGENAPLDPRIKITSVPYSLRTVNLPSMKVVTVSGSSVSLDSQNQLVIVSSAHDVILPSTPNTGQIIYLFISNDSGELNPNGKTIELISGDVTSSQVFSDFGNSSSYMLVYNGSTWSLFSSD
jgi:predicted DNA-binding protein with PD1-like motif